MRLTLWVSLGAPCGQIPSHILRGRHISDRFSPGSRNHVLLFHIEVTEALAVQTFQVPSLLSWGFLAALLALDSFQNHPSPTHPTHSSAPRGPLDVRCWTWGSQGRRFPPPRPRWPLSSAPGALCLRGRPSALHMSWCLRAQARLQASLRPPLPSPVQSLSEA